MVKIKGIHNNPKKVKFNGTFVDKQENGSIVYNDTSITLRFDGVVTIEDLKNTNLIKNNGLDSVTVRRIADDMNNKRLLVVPDSFYTIKEMKNGKLQSFSTKKDGSPLKGGAVTMMMLDCYKPSESKGLDYI